MPIDCKNFIGTLYCVVPLSILLFLYVVSRCDMLSYFLFPALVDKTNGEHASVVTKKQLVLVIFHVWVKTVTAGIKKNLSHDRKRVHFLLVSFLGRLHFAFVNYQNVPFTSKAG